MPHIGVYNPYELRKTAMKEKFGDNWQSQVPNPLRERALTTVHSRSLDDSQLGEVYNWGARTRNSKQLYQMLVKI